MDNMETQPYDAAGVVEDFARRASEETVELVDSDEEQACCLTPAPKVSAKIKPSEAPQQAEAPTAVHVEAETPTADLVEAEAPTAEPVEAETRTAEPVEAEAQTAEPEAEAQTSAVVDAEASTAEPVEAEALTAEPVHPIKDLDSPAAKNQAPLEAPSSRKGISITEFGALARDFVEQEMQHASMKGLPSDVEHAKLRKYLMEAVSVDFVLELS